MSRLVPLGLVVSAFPGLLAVLLLACGAPTVCGDVTKGWTLDVDPVRRLPDPPLRILPHEDGGTLAAGEHCAARFLPGGGEAWVVNHQDAFIHDASWDPQGNLYLLVDFEGGGQRLFHYEPDGQLAWTLDPPLAGEEEGALDGVVASSDGVLVAGWHGLSVAVHSLDSAGNVLWSALDIPEIHNDGLSKRTFLDAGARGSYLVIETYENDTGVVHVSADGQYSWSDLRLGSTGFGALAPGGGLYLVTTDYSSGAIQATRFEEDGRVAWERSFGESPGPFCFAWCAASAPDGRLLIGGMIDRDFLTLLYDAGGSLLWSAVRQAAPFSNSDTGVRGVAFGPDGSSYAAGMVRLTGDSDPYDSSATILVRYDAAGNELWTIQRGAQGSPVRFSALSATLEGDPILGSDSGDDWICSTTEEMPPNIVTFDAGGTERRGSSLACPLRDSLRVYDEAADAQGNVYLAGRFVICGALSAVKVGPDGRVLWSRVTSAGCGDVPVGSYACVDVVDNVGLVGGYQGAYRTTKIDPDGNLLWTADCGEDGRFFSPSGICATPDGGMCVTGSATSPPACVTVQYRWDGSEAWRASFEADVRPTRLRVDAVGYVWIAGDRRSGGPGYYDPAFVLCYDALGSLASAQDRPGVSGLAVDDEGNAFLAISDGIDVRVEHVTAAGEKEWSYTLERPEGQTYAMLSYLQHNLAVDPSGDVVGFGYVAPSAAKWLIFKVSPGGSLRWKTVHDVPAPAADSACWPSALAVDALRAIYVAGPTIGSLTSVIHTVKLRPDGRIKWAADEEVPDCWGEILGVVPQESGRVLVAGMLRCSEPPLELNVIQYIEESPPPVDFVRGDVNADGETDISDAVATLLFLFLGSATVPCEKAADADDGGEIDISDAILILGYLFLGEGAPAAPVSCGEDSTPDDLTCESFAGCP